MILGVRCRSENFKIGVCVALWSLKHSNRSVDADILDPDDPRTKKIKKILREKHPGYEKNSIDGEAFDSLCETISFYLTRGRIEEARAVLNVLPFVPISLSEKEIDNIIQEYSKKKR